MDNKILNIIFPIENHIHNIVQLIIAFESIRINIKRKHQVIIVNHNNSNLPDFFYKYLKNEILINIELTNNKFYYKDEDYFCLMPEVLKYVSENYKGLYLLLDPDVIFLNDFPINLPNNFVYKTKKSNYTSCLLNMFNLSLNENFKEHYDTFFVYTDSIEFINDWYKYSINYALKGRSMNNTFGIRIQHFCEELAMIKLSEKYIIKSNHNLIDAFEDHEIPKKINLKKSLILYHYDFLKILNLLNYKKYSLLLKIYNYKVEQNISIKKIKITKIELKNTNEEIFNYFKFKIPPVSFITKRILRYNLKYDFNN